MMRSFDNQQKLDILNRFSITAIFSVAVEYEVRHYIVGGRILRPLSITPCSAERREISEVSTTAVRRYRTVSRHKRLLVAKTILVASCTSHCSFSTTGERFFREQMLGIDVS